MEDHSDRSDGELLADLVRGRSRRGRRSLLALGKCRRRDSNPHTRRHRNLNPACLPISPLARGAVVVPGKNPGGGRQALLYLLPVCWLQRLPREDEPETGD